MIEGNGIGGVPRSGRKGGNDRSWMMIVYIHEIPRVRETCVKRGVNR